MSEFTSIDLSQLPAPQVVEALSYDTILEELKAALAVEMGTREWDMPSEPIVKILEISAYRELILRQRYNEAAKQVMLAYATGSNLDHLAALLGVERQTDETDARLRSRTQLALEGFSTAGPTGAYVFHALAASDDVKDVSVSSPNPGEVLITVLSNEGDGTADGDLIGAVTAYVSSDDIRPLTDQVTVQTATIVPYALNAELTFYSGPDAATVLQDATTAVTAYVTEHHRMGHDITLSGLYAALHQPGVQNVNLISPANTIVCTATQAAYCTGVTVTNGGNDE